MAAMGPPPGAGPSHPWQGHHDPSHVETHSDEGLNRQHEDRNRLERPMVGEMPLGDHDLDPEDDHDADQGENQGGAVKARIGEEAIQHVELLVRVLRW